MEVKANDLKEMFQTVFNELKKIKNSLGVDSLENTDEVISKDDCQVLGSSENSVNHGENKGGDQIEQALSDPQKGCGKTTICKDNPLEQGQQAGTIVQEKSFNKPVLSASFILANLEYKRFVLATGTIVTPLAQDLLLKHSIELRYV
ncbi:MAG: hypothetical protein MPJ24_01400 [Pirellulaceae bacterium]|nr:hypothetical protein [Pirellulaceae bacterium]